MNCPGQPICSSDQPTSFVPDAGRGGGRSRGAFTLIEMLVVLGIIGMLAAMTLPSINNSRKGNISESVTRQLMDDLANARLKAMSLRTKVYVVFAPDLNWFGALNANQTAMLTTNLAANTIAGGQLTTYALFSPRVVGEQPGQNTPRYLSDWRSLPSGSFIPASLFREPGVFHNVAGSPQAAFIPADDSQGALAMNLPFIGFDEQGRLFGRNTNIAISIIEGSIMHPQDATGQTNQVVNTDEVETSPPVNSGQIVGGIEYLVAGQLSPVGVRPRIRYNGINYSAGQTFVGINGIPAYTILAGPRPRVVQHYGVRIDWITGRAKAIKPELP
ncbi:MAG: type II secretion system protein [Proteobacteria bacterium]|nr:type II secretion system protein [Pseudomonadota bacterium]